MTEQPAVVSDPGKLSVIHGSSKVVLVPTMGNLHTGHISLIKHARELTGSDGKVCVSIFVNPLQFAAEEDLHSYPRTLQADLDQLTGLADTVFAPSFEQMYPQEQLATITIAGLDAIYEGADRPGHFAGVLTAVAQLFAHVKPTSAVFGRKDYQQLVLVRTMCMQQNLPVSIAEYPVVRADDGLALSSRNSRLDQAQRTKACMLYAYLAKAAAAIASGNSIEHACATAREQLSAAGLNVSYVICLADGSLEPVSDTAAGPAVLVAAATLAGVRLLDCVDVKLS